MVVNLFKYPFIEPWHTHTQLTASEDKLWAVKWQRDLAEWQQNWRWNWGGAEGGQWEVKWRWESPAALTVSVFSRSSSKAGLNLQLNPWPAFDLVRGQRAGGEACGVKWGACCCFEVPPRIWTRPIKQDYKSGTAFLLKQSVCTFVC